MLRLFLSSFSVVMVGTIFAFLSQLILAKFLSVEEYGIYSFIFSTSLMLSVISLFGLQNGLVRLIPTLQQNDKEAAKITQLIGFSRALTFVLACGFACFIYGGLYLFGLTKTYPVETFLIGIILVPFMVLLRLNAAILRGFEKSTLSVLYETGLREILFFCALAGLFLGGYLLQDAERALLVLIGALSVSVLFSFVQCGSLISAKAQERTATKEDYKSWLKTSFPMMMIIFAQRFLRRADILFLGIMTQPALVGAYAIAAQFSEASSIGQKGVFAVFSARAAKHYQNNEQAELKALYQRMQLYGIAACGLLCISIALIAPYLYSFFGEGFEKGYLALLILLVGMFINVCFGPIGILMIMSEYEVQAMKITFYAMLGNIVLNPAAIYFYGLEGAATTTSVLLITRAAFCYRYIKKQGVL